MMAEALRGARAGDADLLGSALHDMADGVALLDASGRVCFANSALAAAWGERSAALIGRFLSDFVHAPGDLALSELLADVQRGRAWRGELRGTGRLQAGAVWEVVISTRSGGLVATFRDCTARHALEQLRADFLSMITHDIKAPLTVILGYTEMLTDAEGRSADIPADILGHIRESGEKIHALVNNFLDMSRIESGRLVLDRRPVDLSEVVAHAIDQHAWSARRRGLDLSLDAKPPLSVVADEAQMERVITNLIGNAIKYTPEGGTIRVTTARRNGNVAVAVRDTGRGIPADELPHLFEKYRRVREKHRTEGTGLGLFIAKTIVEAHGGEIEVESAPGAGSTFTLLLPA
jgi:signal transduction histidine kinase